MKNFKHKRCCLLILLLAICFCALLPEHTLAASQPISVTSCKLGSKGKKLTVKAKITQKTSETRKKLYLLALDANASETGAKNSKPLASAKAKDGTVSFSVKYTSTMLYQKFAVAYKTGGKYQIISNTRYITNPEVLATYTGNGPKVTSKKGLQVEDLDESLELGTKHAVINWTINSLLTTDTTSGIPYKYRGKTYYFNPQVLQRNDAEVAAYTAAGVRVTIILLLPNDASAATSAIRFSGSPSAHYSSFKTSSQKGCRTFEALMTFLAERYGTKDQLVSGWILGNEVNNPGTWNYGGDKSLNTYIKNYARAFRICYNAVKSVHKNANVYISLDYNWNSDVDGKGKQYFSTKSTLDKFYQKVNEQGKITFHIAYHCYPQGLMDPVFWDDALATDSLNTELITFRNLKVLTNYVKKNFGKDYTIMLSEQSFNSTKGEAVQAAAYAYAYYMCEGNSMIEAFIYGRQFDNAIEMADGCYWGLSDKIHKKRLIWDVFQYIDTKDTFKFTNPLVKYTNLSKWNEISGFKKSKYEKMPSLRTKVQLGNIMSDSTTSTTLFWYEITAADGYEIYRNGEWVGTTIGHSAIGYTDSGLSPGTTYTYKIRMFKLVPSSQNAEERVRLYGTFSKSKKITTTAAKTVWTEDPCSVDGRHITLSWQAQELVSGYQIFRSNTMDGKYSPLATVTDTTYEDSDTESGKYYYYKVRAYVTNGGKNYYGEYSDPVSAQALIQLDVTIADNKVSLSWTPWPEAVSYQLFCSCEDMEFKKFKTTTEFSYACTTYKDAAGDKAEFESDTSYQFQVRPILADGKKGPSSNIAALTLTADLKGSSKEDDADLKLGTENTETEETENIEPEETESLETGNTEDEASEVQNTETENTEDEASETGNSETENSGDEASEVQNTEAGNSETETSNAGDTGTGNSETEASETGNTENGNTEDEASDSDNTEAGDTAGGASDSDNTETGNSTGGASDSGDTGTGNSETQASDSGDTGTENSAGEASNSGSAETGSSESGASKVQNEETENTKNKSFEVQSTEINNTEAKPSETGNLRTGSSTLPR